MRTGRWRLVEADRQADDDEEPEPVLDRLLSVLPTYNLTPFEAKVQSVGFIDNRIWAAIKRESLAVAAEGVAYVVVALTTATNRTELA